jgi:hypothetical protein
MKTAYLILGTAIALSAAALAGPGTTVRRPDSLAGAAHSASTSKGTDTGREDSMIQDRNSGQVTTTVRNGNNLASVTQSGDPTDVVRRVEKRAGYTKLEQRSGNSRSVIVQSNNPADLPLDQIPPVFRDLFRK